MQNVNQGEMTGGRKARENYIFGRNCLGSPDHETFLFLEYS